MSDETPRVSAEAPGKLRFSGPDVEQGAMEIRAFAPALVGLADLIERTNSVVNGGEVSAKVMVRSSFRRGSFIADFSLVLDGAVQVGAFGAGTYLMGAHEILKAIGIHASSALDLLTLFRKLRGRPDPEVVGQDGNNVQIKVEGDNNIIVAPQVVVELYRDDQVRRAAYSVAKPLEREGIKELQFREGRRVVARLKEIDLESLEAAAKGSRPAPRREPDPSEVEEHVEVLTVDLLQGVFAEHESFRFFDGENKFYARITDEGWWAKIHNRDDGYFEGDRMRIRLLSRQLVDERGKLHREYEVVKVVRHDHAPRQGDLFGGGPDAA